MVRCLLVGEATLGIYEAARSRPEVLYVPIPLPFIQWFEELISSGLARISGNVVELSREVLAQDYVVSEKHPALERIGNFVRKLPSPCIASVTLPGVFQLGSLSSYGGLRLVEKPHRLAALVPMARSVLERVATRGVEKIVVWDTGICAACSRIGSEKGYTAWFVEEVLSYVLDGYREACIYVGPCTNPGAYRALLEAGARCVALRGLRALYAALHEINDERSIAVLADLSMETEVPRGAVDVELGPCLELGPWITPDNLARKALRALKVVERLRSWA